MSQQPYEPYDRHEPYDPYQQQQQQPHAQQWPQGDGYEDAQGHTQTFQGQTWDTQHHPVHGRQAYAQQQPEPQQPQAAADTAYLPPQGYGDGQAGYAQPGYQGGYAAEPLPPQAQDRPAPVPPAEPQAPAPAPEPSADAPGLTAAQRARLEGRSPIIAPGMQPAALTAVLALLLAGGAALGTYALLVPLLLLQALTAAGWFRLNGMWPARQGIALAFLGGVVADVVVLIAGRAYAPAAILGTGGVWVLLTLVLQLRSHAGADERMYGLMATVSSAALAILAAGALAASPEAVTVGAAAVGVAALARALPLPGAASVVVALLAAAGAGIAVGGLTDVGAAGALLGAGAGVCALVGLRVASYDYPSRFVHMTAGVALPLTAAVPALYLLGRVVA